MTNVARLLGRPRPPEHMLDLDATILGIFLPAPELTDWIKDAFLDPGGPLHWAGHEHLNEAAIGCLWTTAENRKKGRSIVGQAQLTTRGGGDPWATARARQQRLEWFGRDPVFLLTFDAYFANDADDATFAALVDHELCHCAQELDEFGAPKYSQTTGDPIWTLRGHDVEEFVSVVRRFGIQAAGEAATDLVIAAADKPEVAPAKLAQACGTCARRAA